MVNRRNVNPQLHLAPNPAAGEVLVEGIDETSLVKIFNLSGQQLSAHEIDPGEVISLQGLSSGIYLLQIYNTQTSQLLKLAVE